MALSRSVAVTNLMNAGRVKDIAMDRRATGKAGTQVQRAALGNISNKSSILSKSDTGKSKIKIDAEKVIVKKKVTSQLVERTVEAQQPVLAQVKEEPTEICVPLPVENHDQSVMDTSSNSQGEEAFSKQMLHLNINDIDKDDKDNPQLVSEYVNDIYDYMRELEERYSIQPLCLASQVEINGRMRAILVDWLVQVHLRFHLLQETLFLTVAILDRYLQSNTVAKTKLQLVGVTSMWIAAKYEEMYAPEVADFVYITDNAYTKVEIRQMECTILSALDFQLGRPLPIHFLRRYSKAGEVDGNTHTLAKYLMELTMVEYDMAHFLPSQIAAAALCLSMKVFEDSSWTATLAHYSKYSESDIESLVVKLAQLVLRATTASKLVAVKTKYQSSKFMRISKIDELNSQLIHDLAGPQQLA